MIRTISAMTTSPSTPAAMAAGAECAACPHLLADHDAIGSRFCQATVDGGISRGCVCGGGAGGLAPARRREVTEAAQWAAGTTARRADT
jgi:hypothetical protein